MKKILKTIYALLPFKKAVFQIMRLVWTPPRSIYKHLSFKGVFKVKNHLSQSFKLQHYGYQIENEIFWEGLDGWEKMSFAVWQHLVQKSNNVFDIGANTGIYALIAKSIKPECTVHVFEPIDRIFQKLEFNFQINNFKGFLNNVAVSNKTGKGIIYDTSAEHVLSVSLDKNFNFGNDFIEKEIDLISLDDYIKTNNLISTDLIKIDVENHEHEVLLGFSDTIEMFMPYILIEILSDEIGKNVQDFFLKKEYKYFIVDEDTGLIPTSKITRQKHWNYLLVPDSKLSEIEELL